MFSFQGMLLSYSFYSSNRSKHSLRSSLRSICGRPAKRRRKRRNTKKKKKKQQTLFRLHLPLHLLLHFLNPLRHFHRHRRTPLPWSRLLRTTVSKNRILCQNLLPRLQRLHRAYRKNSELQRQQKPTTRVFMRSTAMTKIILSRWRTRRSGSWALTSTSCQVGLQYLSQWCTWFHHHHHRQFNVRFSMLARVGRLSPTAFGSQLYKLNQF